MSRVRESHDLNRFIVLTVLASHKRALNGLPHTGTMAATAIGALHDFPLLPDLLHQVYILRTKVAPNNDKRNLKKQHFEYNSIIRALI